MPAKFGVGDAVRFVGTDTPCVVREYNADTLEYRVQCGDEFANSQWASEIYFEPVDATSSPWPVSSFALKPSVPDPLR
jgi:hypothetical protein